jgi:hypothetical protein
LSIFLDDEWVPVNLDNGHLDWYFLLLAGFMALTIGYFYWIASGYEYKTSKDLAIFEEGDSYEDLKEQREALLNQRMTFAADQDRDQDQTQGEEGQPRTLLGRGSEIRSSDIQTRETIII